MSGVLMSYLAAGFQTWAAARTEKNWWNFWRLKKLGLRWQLRNVQKAGDGIEITGPLIIRNAGRIEIGNHARFDSSWHKPICLSLSRSDARLSIEDDSFINYGTEISLLREVVIGAHAMISIDCLIYDTDWHDPHNAAGEAPVAPVRIGRGAWLGARVVVLKGVTIGDNTVVAANSVVTRDLPGGVLAGGIPARVIRPIEWRRYREGR